jgi:hypothetical protein
MIDKLGKAKEALRLHQNGFPEQRWRLMFDDNLQMYSIVSEQYLEEFNPKYLK